jgi:lysophospholipase L1-like esterase
VSAANHSDNQSEAVPASAPASSQPKVRVILRTMAYIAIILPVTLVLVELALRFMGLTDPVLYERDPDVGYRLKPDQHVHVWRNEIVINSYGIRDSRPLKDRDPKRSRVLCLGDSVTWGGIYISQEELFTSIAERKLGNAEVINAGVNGYSITQMIRLYEKYLHELEPDLIVFCVIVRDFERPPVVQLSGASVAFPEERPSFALPEALKIVQLSAYSRTGWNWLQPPSAVISPTDNSSNEAMNIEALAAFTRRVKSKPAVIVIHIPVTFGMLDREIRLQYQERLSDNGVRTRSIRRFAGVTTEDLVDNIHLAVSGHRKVGDALASVLYEELAPESDTDPEGPL